MKIDSLLETVHLACPMCMSGQNGQSQIAASSAIAFLLVVLSAVLLSFLSFIVYLAKREGRFVRGGDESESD